MQLTPESRDWLLGLFVKRLDAGAVVFYPVNPHVNPLAEPLATVALGSPAFLPIVEGVAEAYELAPAKIQKTGEARWADLVTAIGEAIGFARVRLEDDPAADVGDVLLKRTDFHQGGDLTLSRVTLTLPLQL